MAARRRSGGAPGLGHDAFLDIVANLVGILIILVVVLGSRTQEVAELIRTARGPVDPGLPPSLPPDAPSIEAVEAQLRELDVETSRATQALADSQRLEHMIQASDVHLAAARQRRDQWLDLVAAAKEAWEEQQREFDEQTVERGKVQAKLVTAQAELETLRATREQSDPTDRPVVAVSHLPTPMAKTVFGEELHFRLKAGRLAVVPIDRLIDEIRNDFQRSASGSRNGRMDAAVGPVQGFVARYEMDRSRETVSQGGRVGTATRVQLVSMVVEPLAEPHGQPLAEVLANQANLLDIELAGRSPDRTTVTVWVYPDSFAEFRRLKEHLYQRGYATAARPLPMGVPIAGGPQGSKSTAQ